MQQNDKRQRILDTSLSLFTSRGFDGTPTALIASEAKLATGTLFHYFASKEALIRELYSHCKQSIRLSVSAGKSDADSLRDQVRSIAVAYVHWGLEYPREFQFFQQFRNSPYLGADVLQQEAERFEPLIQLFKLGIQSGELKPISVEYLLGSLNALLDAAVQHFSHPRWHFDEPQEREGFLSVVWDAIRKG